MNHSYSNHIVPYEKSVVLGGARVLFPVPQSLTNSFAQNIRMTVKEAEALAYERGYRDAQTNMRKVLGLK